MLPVVTMATEVATTGRDAVLVEDSARIRIVGFPVLEALWYVLEGSASTGRHAVPAHDGPAVRGGASFNGPFVD
jgi:hypothetical protein